MPSVGAWMCVSALWSSGVRVTVLYSAVHAGTILLAGPETSKVPWFVNGSV